MNQFSILNWMGVALLVVLVFCCIGVIKSARMQAKDKEQRIYRYNKKADMLQMFSLLVGLFAVGIFSAIATAFEIEESAGEAEAMMKSCELEALRVNDDFFSSGYGTATLDCDGKSVEVTLRRKQYKEAYGALVTTANKEG